MNPSLSPSEGEVQPAQAKETPGFSPGRTSLLPAIALLAVACNSGQQEAQSQKDLIQYQSLCNNFGETIRKNVNRPNPQIFTHYNTVMKKCFVEETSTANEGKVGDLNYGTIGNSEDVIFDGEKGTLLFDLTTYFTGSSNNQLAYDQRPINGITSVVKITPEQFTTLKDQYMNN